MERVFKWNGTNVAFPSSLAWSYTEIASEKSGRTLAGKMIKEIIAVKRKVTCSWSGLADVEGKKLLETIKRSTFGNLTYPDAFEGKDSTRKFYTGDAAANAKLISDGVYVWDISFDFIEQ